MPLPLSATGRLSPIMEAYLREDGALRPFYGQPVSTEGFAAEMQARASFPLDRDALADALMAQYAGMDAPESAQSIGALRDSDTFTVTTGHQLSLFSGPLYFIYKISHAIRLAQQLSAEFPGRRFVPVFWMNTEDHDLEEIATLHLFGKAFTWDTAQTGPAGRMAPDGLPAMADAIGDVLKSDGLALLALFREAYATAGTLSGATRLFAHRLFGHHGLVILDSDDPALKRLFAAQMAEDALRHTPSQAVSATTERLRVAGFHAQVHPREVNTFYLGEGGRHRIVRTPSGFEALGTGRSWPEAALAGEMAAHPGRFSPNVVLRPMFQEHILPNLAYIGGPGELAYWLQYREAFARMGISFPILVLRAHFLLIDPASASRMDELGLSPTDLFKDEDTLIRELVAQSVGEENVSLDAERSMLRGLFASLRDKAAAADPTLSAAAEAELARQEKTLEQWEGRIARAHKQRSEVSVQRLRKLLAKLFPGGALQERHDNLLQYAELCPHPLLLQRIMDAIGPLGQGQMHIIRI